MRLRDWQIKRSGPSMTVIGRDVETDMIVRLTNIVTVKPSLVAGGRLLAIDRNDAQHHLEA